MVSSCALYFDEIFIDGQKASVPDDFVYLFQESDREELSPERGKDGDHVSMPVSYRASRAVVLERLDLGGFTSDLAAQAFQVWLEDEREDYNRYVDEGGEWAADTAEALATFSYVQWKARLKDVLVTHYDLGRDRGSYADEIDRLMRDGEGLAFGDTLTCIRAMLDALPDVQEVSLEIGSLIHGGWIEPDAKICEAARNPVAQGRSILAPAVIMAEGSTDTLVLQRSLERLYPQLSEYITFFDYEGLNPDGGAAFLVKFLRAFAAARISTLVLAVFDNDAVGLDALRAATALLCPKTYA